MLLTILIIAVVAYYFVVSREPSTPRQFWALSGLILVNGIVSVVNLFVP